MRIIEFKEKFPSVKTHTVEEIAKKHDVDAKEIRKQLSKGTKIELEHTTDSSVAKEIALDHLAEFPDYYDRLEKVEEDVVDFPTKEVRHRAMLDKLKKRSSMYDELTGQPIGDHPDKRTPVFFVIDKDGKGHAQFDSYADAEKAIPRLELKSGKRGLFVK